MGAGEQAAGQPGLPGEGRQGRGARAAACLRVADGLPAAGGVFTALLPMRTPAAPTTTAIPPATALPPNPTCGAARRTAPSPSADGSRRGSFQVVAAHVGGTKPYAKPPANPPAPPPHHHLPPAGRVHRGRGAHVPGHGDGHGGGRHLRHALRLTAGLGGQQRGADGRLRHRQVGAGPRCAARWCMPV